MKPIVRALLACAVSLVRSRVSLQLEILALRHQLTLYQRSIRRPQVRPSDRILWSWLARRWSRWREVLVFVQPATVLAWQHTRFRAQWGLGFRKNLVSRSLTPCYKSDIPLASGPAGAPLHNYGSAPPAPTLMDLRFDATLAIGMRK